MASLMVQSIVSAHPIRVLKNHITHKEYSFLHLYFAFLVELCLFHFDFLTSISYHNN